MPTLRSTGGSCDFVPALGLHELLKGLQIWPCCNGVCGLNFQRLELRVGVPLQESAL